MAKELGVGIIGCGNISTTYFGLSPLFKGLKVLACADINMNAAELRAEEYKVKAQTIDELLANDEIDVVVNLTIPDAHYPGIQAHSRSGQARLFGKAAGAFARAGRRAAAYRQG